MSFDTSFQINFVCLPGLSEGKDASPQVSWCSWILTTKADFPLNWRETIPNSHATLQYSCGKHSQKIQQLSPHIFEQDAIRRGFHFVLIMRINKLVTEKRLCFIRSVIQK